MIETDGDSLTAALSRHEIELPESHVAWLDQYATLLWQRNQKLNLTRHTDYEKFVARDVFDSLQLARFLESGEQVLDLGTGGGVPGVILAVVRPDLSVSLCESVAKRAAAVESIVRELKLPVPVHNVRVEAMLSEVCYDVLVARAVAPLDKMLGWLAPHWDRVGRLLVVKGRRWLDERRAARERGLMRKLELRRLATYSMPGTAAQSVVLQIRPRPPKQSSS